MSSLFRISLVVLLAIAVAAGSVWASTARAQAADRVFAQLGSAGMGELDGTDASADGVGMPLSAISSVLVAHVEGEVPGYSVRAAVPGSITLIPRSGLLATSQACSVLHANPALRYWTCVYRL